MAMTTNLLSGQASEWALLKRHESEDLFGIQLAGSYPDTFTKACQLLAENCSFDFVDINCGCPIDLVFNKGAGCALMSRIDQFQKIFKGIDTVLDVPVTVKIRTGIKEDVFIAHELIPELKAWGADMITLHGRTRQQRYSKLADWEYIKKCAEISDPVPLFGCGDILSYHDYNAHMNDSKISGCMLARLIFKIKIVTK
jgi:tRNA-dihydrouridine synthase 3